MKTKSTAFHNRAANWTAIALAWAVSLMCSALSGSLHTQSFALQPGWNSIYVQVQPEDNSPETVFTGLDVESVWTFSERLSTVDYIQDPNEPIWNQSEWLVYIPEGKPAAFQTSFFAVLPNRSYLVRLAGTEPATLNITGRPILEPKEWSPNAYNLTGFHVDPDNPPTFNEYFKYSTAHFDNTTQSLQPMYRLNQTGQWERVSGTDSVEAGKAYWIHCQGGSQYAGPLKVSLDSLDGIDFDVLLEGASLIFGNETGADMNITVRDLTTGASALSYYQFDADTAAGYVWNILPENYSREIPAGITDELKLAVRRQDFQTEFLETLLEIKNEIGTRILVYVHAAKNLPSGDPGIGQVTTQAISERGRAISLMSANPTDIAKTHAGLWFGEAAINQVAQSTDPNTLAPSGSEFSLRLLLHVDENGETRLLKQVTLMRQEATFTTDIEGDLVVDQPSRYVLITKDDLISEYAGIGLRSGEPVGRRLSAPSFDWPDSITGNTSLPLSGSFAEGEELTGSITLSPNLPTNPFRHKYHPDHDNLNAQFQPITDPAQYENYEIHRQFSITLKPTPDDDRSPVTHYGYDTLDGVFTETISGLHKQPIQVSGTFRLERISTIAVLNR